MRSSEQYPHSGTGSPSDNEPRTDPPQREQGGQLDSWWDPRRSKTHRNYWSQTSYRGQCSPWTRRPHCGFRTSREWRQGALEMACEWPELNDRAAKSTSRRILHNFERELIAVEDAEAIAVSSGGIAAARREEADNIVTRGSGRLKREHDLLRGNLLTEILGDECEKKQENVQMTEYSASQDNSCCSSPLQDRGRTNRKWSPLRY